MTTTTQLVSPRPRRPAPSSRRRLGDVVAGLVNDGSAYAVARAAAREASHRGTGVRFLQVVPVGLGMDERADVDRATFRAALDGLRGLPRVGCTFEVVDGEVAQALIERSRDAALLVVGRDLPVTEHDVARVCQRDAACDVLTVFTAASSHARVAGSSSYGG